MISIIIPVYNKIIYLSFLLEDIRNQSFRDYECLLIDDGSTDGSSDVCNYFAGKDRRFVAYHTANQGVSVARNLGLDKAKGDYITFIDGDDRIHPEYLENLYTCFLYSGADMVIGGYKKVWKDTGRETCVDTPYSGSMSMKKLLPRFAEIQKDTGLLGVCVAKIFERNLLEGNRFDTKLRLAEDFEFYLKLYRRIEIIYFDDKPYYEYLQCAKNSSVQVRDEQIDYRAQLDINLRYRKFLIDKKSFSGNNKRIVMQIISNYMYFTLFYVKLDKMAEIFEELYQLCKKEGLVPTGQQWFQKWLLFLLRHHQYGLAKLSLWSYRMIRKMIRQ